MSAHYTSNDLILISELAKSMTAAQVAEKFDRTRAAIQQIAHRHGIKFGSVNYKKHTNRDVKNIIELRNQGLTYREVSKRSGVSLTSCMYLYRRYA